MKEMNYTTEGKFEILESATYEGYNYLVVSYGTHPCCYVQMDENHTFFDENKYKWDWDLPISCHGGITFRGEFGKKCNVQGSFIGWDYCHCDDYAGYNPTFGGRTYTTEELIQDCHDVIGQIIQFEVEQQQNQEEVKKSNFLEEAVTMSGLIYGDVNSDFVDGCIMGSGVFEISRTRTAMTIFGEMIKRSYKEDTLKAEDFCQIYFENGEPLKIDGVYKDIPYSISSNGEFPDIDIAFPYTVSTFTGLKEIELYNRNKKKIEFYRHIAFRIIYCTHSYSDLGDYVHNKDPDTNTQ